MSEQQPAPAQESCAVCERTDRPMEPDTNVCRSCWESAGQPAPAQESKQDDEDAAWAEWVRQGKNRPAPVAAPPVLTDVEALRAECEFLRTRAAGLDADVERRNRQLSAMAVERDALRDALQDAVEDAEARWDMTSRSTNPGIVAWVERGRDVLSRLAAVSPQPQPGADLRDAIRLEAKAILAHEPVAFAECTAAEDVMARARRILELLP